MRFFFLFLATLFLPIITSAQVVISEVMWAGSPVSTADEWFEIVNITNDTAHLSGWSITKRGSDGSDTSMITFEEDAVIEPDLDYV